MAAEQVKLYLDMACKGHPGSKAEIAHIAQIASHLCIHSSYSLLMSQAHGLPMPSQCVNV